MDPHLPYEEYLAKVLREAKWRYESYQRTRTTTSLTSEMLPPQTRRKLGVAGAHCRGSACGQAGYSPRSWSMMIRTMRSLSRFIWPRSVT